MRAIVPIVQLQNVTKKYSDVVAVDDLSFELVPGRIFGLLGPNGAGKTTTIRMMVGIIVPDSGSVTMLGKPLERRNLRRAGYLPEERGLYAKMTARDNLTFFARLSGLDIDGTAHRIRDWAERLEIADRLDDKVEQLSKGMQQKIQFMAAVIHDPLFIVMDEPFTALDPVNVNTLKKVLYDLRAQGKAIVFSTHRMDQVEQLCDELCLMNDGRAVLQGGLREIKSRYADHCVEIAFDGDAGFLDANPNVESYQRRNDHVEVRLKPGADPQALLQSANSATRIRRFETREASIEEIFIELMGRRDAAS